MEAIKIKRTIEVKIEDKEGGPIKVGSVLRSLKDGTRGVVNFIATKEGDNDLRIQGPMWVGDIQIQTGHGTYRITNMYNDWTHISHNEQTYIERHRSWLITPFESSWMEGDAPCSEDEEYAVQGIMALLPDDIVNTETGPFADRLDEALKFLTDHLTEVKNDQA